jgi:hypothetical protein
VQCIVPSTGITEPSYSSTDALIYPNPNNGIFHLQLKNSIKQHDVKLISIYNLQGDLIFQTTRFVADFEIKNLSKGVYLIQIQFSRNKLTKKLIVQ